jgi:hypothetical protein
MNRVIRVARNFGFMVQIYKIKNPQSRGLKIF